MFGYKMSDYDKKVYEEELVDFLPKNIVDSHVHIWRKEDDLFDRVNHPIYWPDRVAGECTIEDSQETYKSLFPKNEVIPIIF